MRAFGIGLVALFLLAAAPASAPAPASQPTVAVGTGTVTPTVASPEAEHVPTPAEVVKEAGAVAAAAGEYFTGSKEGDAAAKKFGLLALITTVLKLLLSLLKMASSFWSETRGKWVLRIITLGLGVVIAIVSSMAIGMPWWDAVLLGLSGPGAVALHEYQKLIPALSKKKTKK